MTDLSLAQQPAVQQERQELREQRQEVRQARRDTHDRQGQHKFTLASKVIGMEVKAKGDEKVGEIRNLLISQDGQIEYLAVSTSASGADAAATPRAQIIQPDRAEQGTPATATAAGKLTLVPWDAVKLQHGETAAQSFVMIEIEKDRLMTAPSFTEQQLTADAGQTTQWTTQVDQFFNVRSQRGAARPELDRDRSQQQDQNRRQGTQPRSGETPRSDSTPGADSNPSADDN